MSSRVTKTSVFCGLSFTRDAEVRDLDDRRARRGIAAEEAVRARKELALSHRCPHETGPARSQRARQIEPVRLHAIGRDREATQSAFACRRRAEVVLLQPSSVGIRFDGVSAAAHCLTSRKLRA